MSYDNHSRAFFRTREYNFLIVSFSYTEADIAELLSEFNDPHARESVELAALPEMLDGASYFIDVGANAGQYIFHAARHLRKARLVAIEANPLLIPVLTRTIENLRSHGDAANEYEIRAAAVSDIPGSLEFHISKYPTLSSVFPNGTAETVSVPTVGLDDFYRPSVRTLIKIDVEGSEYRAIRSAPRFLKSNHTAFFVELHSWGDRGIGKYPLHVCWLFLMHGYGLRKIGTHYFFYKTSRLKRTVLFLGQFPALSVKYLVCRYAAPLRPKLNRLQRRLAPLLVWRRPHQRNY